jgi:hypothetical protein
MLSHFYIKVKNMVTLKQGLREGHVTEPAEPKLTVWWYEAEQILICGWSRADSIKAEPNLIRCWTEGDSNVNRAWSDAEPELNRW